MMYRKILLLIGIIGFNLVLMIWSISSLAQTGGTPPKDPSEVYQEKSVQINQTYAKEYLSLARWCKTKKLFDQAEENFQLVLKYDAENKQARKQIEKGFPKSARLPRNIEQLLKWYDQRLLALYKKLADKHYTLGLWCKKNNLPDEADKEFDRAIELCFDHQETRKALGQVKVKGFGWVDKETAAKLKKGLREYKGEWLPKAKINKLCSKWEDALEIKTKHYLVRTNNTYEQGYEIGQVAEDLYQMYFKVLGKALELKEPEDLMSIYYFRSEDDYKTEYQRITSHPPPFLTGLYLRGIKTAFSWGPRKKWGRDEKDTARHEYIHQLNHLAAGGLPNAWIEEGLAVYFESVRRDKNGRLTVGDIKHPRFDGKTRDGWICGFPKVIIRQDVIKLKRFLQLRMTEMTGPGAEAKYLQAAALVRFFLNSKPGQRYRDRFLKFVQMCYTAPINLNPKTGGREIDALKAFQECFPKVDLDELEKEFLAGWDK